MSFYDALHYKHRETKNNILIDNIYFIEEGEAALYHMINCDKRCLNDIYQIIIDIGDSTAQSGSG